MFIVGYDYLRQLTFLNLIVLSVHLATRLGSRLLSAFVNPPTCKSLVFNVAFAFKREAVLGLCMKESETSHTTTNQASIKHRVEISAKGTSNLLIMCKPVNKFNFTLFILQAHDILLQTEMQDMNVVTISMALKQVFYAVITDSALQAKYGERSVHDCSQSGKVVALCWEWEVYFICILGQM